MSICRLSRPTVAASNCCISTTKTAPSPKLDQSIDYEDATFRVASRRVGAVDVDMTYTEYGELQTMTTNRLDFAFVYDDLGRLTQVTETDQGTTRTLDYAYDLLGQLTEVRTDGVITATYANGNRLTAPNLTTATYSDSDELLSYDGRTFTYEAGQLTSMTEGATTTTYDYGMFGELLAVDDAPPRGRSTVYLLGRLASLHLNWAKARYAWDMKHGKKPAQSYRIIARSLLRILTAMLKSGEPYDDTKYVNRLKHNGVPWAQGL